MLNTPHPDDERLSALASYDTDATADASLIDHVTSCDRCTDLVTELGALRASLADLPDLRPSRPLRLLPDAEPAASDVGWVRRIFAPMLTAGAAMALVGVVGTSLPALDGMASGGGDQAGVLASEQESAAGGAGADDAPAAAEDGAEESTGDDATARTAAPAASAGVQGFLDDSDSDGDRTARADDDEQQDLARELPAERSPWPMLLFTGVAVMIVAGLLRWVLVPRAG